MKTTNTNDLKARRAEIRRMMLGKRSECREMVWALVLEFYGMAEDAQEYEKQLVASKTKPDAAKDAETKAITDRAILGVLAEMSAAAERHDEMAFVRLAECIAARKKAAGGFADPLSSAIVNFAGGAHGGVFNIEQFSKGRDEDRKTITARVRALGFRYQVGRPRKT